MTFTQPVQRVHTGAWRVRVERAVPMKAAAIIAALGIALIVTMGPAPASAQTTVVRECGDHYVVTHYNSDGSVKGVHNKQLSAQGTIYTAGKTWRLVEGSPDRFVSDGGAQLQVSPCDATLGVEVRQFQRQVPGTQRQVQGTQSSTTLVSNLTQNQFGQVALSNDLALAFTTGSHSAGYTLTGVRVSMQKFAGMQPAYQATINTNTSGRPGNQVGALDTPSPSQTVGFANQDFTASGGSIDLEANTTYWFFINSSSSTSKINVSTTDSDNEDSGGADGWSIANKGLLRNHSATSWFSTSALRLAVIGYATPLPALASAEVNGTSLVLNFDKDLDTTSRTAARQFGIRFGGGALQRATAISISGKQVTLKVPEVRSGQVVTVSYTVPTRNPLKDSNGVAAAAFSDQAVTVNTGPAFGRLPASGKVRDAVYVTADNGEVTEIGAYSADRETLWDYYVSQCTHLRSVSDPYRDYSLFNADGRRIQAQNGWKWVEVQNAAGDVTGTRPMTINECTGNAVYQRQAFCNNYSVGQLAPSNEDNVCPDDRSW